MDSKGRSSTRKAANEVPRKGKAAVRRLKERGDDAKMLEVKKKGIKKVQSRESGNGDVFEGNVRKRWSKTTDGSKQNLRLKSGNERPQVVFKGNSDRKRKRIYADSGPGVDRSYDRKTKIQDGKSAPVDEKRVLRSFFNKERKVIRGNGGEFEKTSIPGRRIFNSNQSLDHKFSRGRIKSADTANDPQNNDLGNRTLKKKDKKTALLTEKTCLTQRTHAVDSENRPYKKRAQDRKSLALDADLKDDVPKKKKRGIRLDPHDTSNKRLNDDIDKSSNSKEKKELTENGDVEISMNAKFRAIRPSPSIISFVEDNLLGRRREIVFRRSGYNIELSAPLDNIPFSTSSERDRIEVPVFRNKLEFYAAAKISSSFPPPDFPEIAFAGRSNVGKSSLLNALTRQWGVVRTSDKPGLTQTINFFKLGPKLSLVDLPGYGFAYAKDEVKEAWEELVKEYVSSRACLKRVCLLIDTQWGMKPRDHELIDLMERSQTKYQIVLTKTDLVFPITVARRAMEIEESLKAKKSAVQPLMMISSRTGAGIRSLRTVLGSIARFVKH